MTETSPSPLLSPARPKVDQFGAQLGGKRVDRRPNANDRAYAKVGTVTGPDGKTQPVFQPPEKVQTKEKSALPKTKEVEKKLDSQSARARVAEIFNTTAKDLATNSHEADVKELAQAAEDELKRLTKAIEQQVIDEKRAPLVSKLGLTPPLEEKDEKALAQLLSDAATQTDIASEVQKRTASQKKTLDEAQLAAKEKRQKAITEDREKKIKTLLELASADNRGNVNRGKIVNGIPQKTPKGEIVTESVDVNDEILQTLKEIPGQEALAKEFENSRIDELVIDTVDQTLLTDLRVDTKDKKTPNSSAGRLSLLRALYENETAEGKNVIAAYMYQEIQQAPSATTSESFAKLKPHNSQLNARLDDLLAKHGVEYEMDKIDRKNIVKCFTLAALAHDKPGVFLSQDQNGLKFSAEGNQIVFSKEWGIKPSEKKLILNLLTSGNFSSAVQAFHLPIHDLTNPHAVNTLANSAVSAIAKEQGLHLDKKTQAKLEHNAAFHMGLWAEKLGKEKDPSALTTLAPPLILMLLMNLENILSTGEDTVAPPRRSH